MIQCDECGTRFQPIDDRYKCPMCGTENHPPADDDVFRVARFGVSIGMGAQAALENAERDSGKR